MSELELLEGLKPCPFCGQPIAKSRIRVQQTTRI